MEAPATAARFFRIFYKTACDIYTDRNGKEFLQLSKPSELSQHDLAEYKFSGCSAQACGERIKEHCQRQRNEQKILD